MKELAFAVGSLAGLALIGSVCTVFLKKHMIQHTGVILAAFGTILIGMSVWKRIDVSMDEKGMKATLEMAMATANEAKATAENVRLASQQNTEAVVALHSSLQAFQIQDKLRVDGIYKGSLDGQFGAKTANSIEKFQEMKNLPKTGTLDPKTIQAMDIKPIQDFPDLKKLESYIRYNENKENLR